MWKIKQIFDGIMGVKSWQKVSHLRFLLHLLMRVDRRSMYM